MKSGLTAVMLWASIAGMSSADLVISAENVTLDPTTSLTGSLEVYVQLTEGTTLPALFGVTTYVSLSPDSSGVSFTDVGKTIDHTYAIADGIGPIVTTKTASTIDVSDFVLDEAGFIMQNNAGLLRIDFEVAPGTATGKFDVLISTSHAKTFIVDNSDPTIIYYYDVYNHGSITIVPEPGSLVLILLSALAAICYFKRFK